MVFLIIGVAVWLAFVIFSLTLSIRPETVKIIKVFICQPDVEMIVQTETYSYHRPGQRAIIIHADGPDGLRDIKARALVALWLFYFVLSIPIATILVFWLGPILNRLSG